MKKSNYILGLDLGTESIGWGCMLVNETNDPYKILDLGSRIFTNKGSKLEERRIARGTRRLIRRRKGRKIAVRNLFMQYSYIDNFEQNITINELNNELSKDLKIDNLYNLKIKGKSEKLTYKELYVILIHYVNSRGFKSNRKIDLSEEQIDKTSEEGKLKLAINNTKLELKALKEKEPNSTISNLIIEKAKVDNKFRNSSKDYRMGITREMIEEEVDIVLNKQIEKGMISKEFKDDFENDVLLKQRSFSVGPDRGIYHNPLIKMIGACSFEKNEARASKDSLSYCIFVLTQKLTDIQFKYNNDKTDKTLHRLSNDNIKSLVEQFKNGKEITYAVVAKEIKEDILIKNIDKENINEENRKKPLVKKSKNSKFGSNYQKLYKALKKAGFSNLDDIYYDFISEVYLRCKSDIEIQKCLNNIKAFFVNSNSYNVSVFNDLQLSKELEDFILNYNGDSFKTVGSLSLKAIYNLLPKMLDGKNYYEACQENGYDSNAKMNDVVLEEIPDINSILEDLEMTINNSYVTRTLVEARKVVNAVIKLYGRPKEIHVEMARDLTKNEDEKKELTDRQNRNFINREADIYEIYNKHPECFSDISKVSSNDRLKWKLYKEQKGICLYTLARTGDMNASKIDENILFTDYGYEIEHIISYSKSGDDRSRNKILVSSKENQELGDSIPGVYYRNKPGWNAYESFVDELYAKTETRNGFEAKRERLLGDNIYDFLGDYQARTVNDTRYAMKAFNKILDYSFKDLKIKTYVGSITEKLRGVWRLNNLTSSYGSKTYEIKKNIDKNDEEVISNFKEFIETKLNEGLSYKNIIKDKEYKLLFESAVKVAKKGKKNRENHFHHAIDAIILACATDKIRHRVELREKYLKSQNEFIDKIEYQTFEVDESGQIVVDEKTGEVKTINNSITKESILNSLSEYMKKEESNYPLPYIGFTNELKVRALEMDKEELHKQLQKIETYSPEEIEQIKPLLISHYYNSKISGKLHEDTYYGKRNNNNKDVITVKMPLKSEKFTPKIVEKIYDKDVTQKEIYLKIKEWIGGDDKANGLKAYELKNGYPINKNGKEIKKVRVIKHDDIMGSFELKPNSGIYVDKENNVETWIYKNKNDNHLYFAGMDRFRLLKVKNNEDFDILLSFKQGDNGYTRLSYNDLESKGFYLVSKLPVGITAKITLKGNRDAICIIKGASSGILEVKSITGDNFDLKVSEIIGDNHSSGRTLITITNIIDIKPISVDVLGKIH